MFIQKTRRISGYTVIFVFSFFLSIFLNFHVAKSTKAVISYKFFFNFTIVWYTILAHLSLDCFQTAQAATSQNRQQIAVERDLEVNNSRFSLSFVRQCKSCELCQNSRGKNERTLSTRHSSL